MSDKMGLDGILNGFKEYCKTAIITNDFEALFHGDYPKVKKQIQQWALENVVIDIDTIMEIVELYPSPLNEVGESHLKEALTKSNPIKLKGKL